MSFRHAGRFCAGIIGLASAFLTTAVQAQVVAGAKIGQANTYAFLVGCADYDRRELRPLEFTVRDIQEFHQILLSSGVQRDNIVLMHDQQPRNFVSEAKKIREQLDLLLARVDRRSTLIVALSGHGVQFEGKGTNYFCPLDARLQDPTTLISLDEIYKQLERCPAERKLLLVDACRNEPQSALAKSRAVVDLATVSRPQEQAVPRGIVALFSCSAGQQSYEHPNLKHGVFFYQMLEGWKGAADANRDSSVTLDELLAYTKLKTEAFAHLELGAKQIPNLKGDFSGTWILRELPQATRLASLPVGPKVSSLRWLGVSIHDPSVLSKISGQVNLVQDRSWQEHGDQLAQAARRHGQTLIAAFHRKEYPAAEPKLFDFVRRNRDVVAAVCFLSPYTASEGFTPIQVGEFGRRLKQEFPGLSFWASYIEMPGGMREPLPAVPPEVDVVEVTTYWAMSPEMATEAITQYLPAWKARANGRPMVLRWVSRPVFNWTPASGGLKTSAGTLLKFADLAIKNNCIGVMFDQYGPRSDNWSPALETDPTAVAELQRISQSNGFSTRSAR